MIEMDFPAGTRVEWAIRNAHAAVCGTGYTAEFKINGVTLRVDTATNPHALFMDYCRSWVETPRNTIGPRTQSSSKYSVVVVIYGEIEEVQSFNDKFERDAWIAGASYGADKYGGSLGLYHENELPRERDLRDKVWKKLLSLAESEESI